ncbi:hypothetical protein SAY87_020046 [Trapa incisa]|uniref:Uncharacterized protein n=1 Tax=Trapa incisa TaxID=236973 RepID=A0AAN7K0U3_9MYRT|nr:hypothetical protein SAY87_020046 [Trapa incisa]
MEKDTARPSGRSPAAQILYITKQYKSLLNSCSLFFYFRLEKCRLLLARLLFSLYSQNTPDFSYSSCRQMECREKSRVFWSSYWERCGHGNPRTIRRERMAEQDMDPSIFLPVL